MSFVEDSELHNKNEKKGLSFHPKLGQWWRTGLLIKKITVEETDRIKNYIYHS